MTDQTKTEDMNSVTSEVDGDNNLFAKPKEKDELPNESSDDSEDQSPEIRSESGMATSGSATWLPPQPRRKRFVPKYEIEGVLKIVLTEDTQAAVELCIGPDVNAQHPWKEVKKNIILEHIESAGENSEFFPLKDELTAYKDDHILMGYIVDESKDTDEFYICFTKSARDHCKQQSDKFHRRQQKKLEKAVQKKPRPWTTLGSAVEITELIPVNTRPLIEVEIKTRFPTVYQPEKFKARDTNTVRDGYIELTPYRVKYSNVYRKRVDNATQVAPSMVDTEMQTLLRYPKNMWTQSIADSLGAIGAELETAAAGGDGAGVEVKSDDEDDTSSSDGSKKGEEEKDLSIEAYKEALRRMRRPSAIRRFNAFMISKHDEIDSITELNTVMDLYSNDYPKLSKTEVFDKYDTMMFNEYICFTDVRAKNKYVSSAVFHPMWTGVVAISYSTGSPAVMTSPGELQDPIQQMVYGLNPVLIWSHTDSLLPKLFLESMREVKVLAFCPFNENILVGGCMNGQIVLWDLTKKLEEVEDFEVLSETREKYRIAINSQMGWMKNVHDKSIVPYTALSLLLHSHYGPILSINWLSPNYTVTPTGQRVPLEPDSARSSIFFSGSEDGTILIWNLSIENVQAGMDGKKIKKSKRVLKRPSALSLGISPLKILDRNWQPVYKVILGTVGVPDMIPPQSIGSPKPLVSYHHIPKNDGSGRKYFGCKLEEEKQRIHKVYCGSIYGEVLRLSWEGHDFNTGEVVNSEYCDIKFRSALHDGTVTSTLESPFIDSLYLTIGGKIFAIWSDEIIGRPLLWKKRNSRLTDAAWSPYRPSLFFISTVEGNIESWDLKVKSDGPLAVQTLSGSMITSVSAHTLPLTNNLIGVSDTDGSFRMFLNPPIFMLESPTYLERTQALFAREIETSKRFHEWQSKWAEANAHILKETRLKELTLVAEKEEQRRKELEDEEQRRKEEEEAKRLLEMRVITPEERWRMIINKLIEKTIAVKKRINRAELLAQEQPLREIEFQRLEKEKKVLEVMKNQKNIFNEIVAIWFPEALEKKVVVEDVLSADERVELQRQYMNDYEQLAKNAKETVQTNPYCYKFDWDLTLTEGQERAQSLNVFIDYIMEHKRRLRNLISKEKFKTYSETRSQIKKTAKSRVSMSEMLELE